MWVFYKKNPGIDIYFNQICSICIFNGSAAHGGTQFIVLIFKCRGLRVYCCGFIKYKGTYFPFLIDMYYSMTKLHFELPIVILFVWTLSLWLKFFLISLNQSFGLFSSLTDFCFEKCKKKITFVLLCSFLLSHLYQQYYF